ncbi:hypothetical protein SLEP1_g17175 [Rubroshorea leprosula]|uniref:Uncharacterized protein n=1 Tax=Rubroshorea leprosula TaxID=152421 RepID=A0AAV5IYY0_9ROSI|nr:hypothetical protein SLEP1_g17175 [Rubroshorea leprosula]
MEFVRNEVDALYHEMVVDAMGAQSEYNDGSMAEEPNKMLNMKTLYNMSATNWEMALSLSRKLLSPKDQEKVPKDFYSAKKMINLLGLGYKKIDICVNDCFLYYDEQGKNLTACPVCGESRYEPRNMTAIRQKDVPRKSLWARAIIDTSSLSDGGNVYYQDDDPLMPQLVQPPTALNDHVSLASQGGEEVVISEVMQLPYVTEEECVGEDDDEEEEFDGTETLEEEVSNYLTESDNMRRGTRGASSSRQQVDLEGEPQRSFRHLIRGPHRTFPTKLQQEQPTITQPPLADDQFTGDDATMEEDTEMRNLEVELDAKYVMLDPKLDAQLEEELSHVVLKTGRGMDKGDDTLADPNQRKVLSLNRRGTFSHERSPKYIALQERGRQNRSKGNYVTHTTGCLSIGIHEDRLFELTQVREEMVERVQTEVATRIHTEVSQRVSKMEANFERRFQEHMRLLSQQYSMNATQPQTGYPSSAPPQIADPFFEGFRLDHFPPHS